MQHGMVYQHQILSSRFIRLRKWASTNGWTYERWDRNSWQQMPDIVEIAIIREDYDKIDTPVYHCQLQEKEW